MSPAIVSLCRLGCGSYSAKGLGSLRVSVVLWTKHPGDLRLAHTSIVASGPKLTPTKLGAMGFTILEVGADHLTMTITGIRAFDFMDNHRIETSTLVTMSAKSLL